MDKNVIYALILTIAAGMATTIGSIIAVFTKKTNTKFLAASLGFSAGVMLYVSMIEIFSKSKNFLMNATSPLMGYSIAVISFFAGVLLIGMIDYFVPSAEGDIGHCLNCDKIQQREENLKRMGFLTALAIGIHNFPEGMVTFTSALRDPHLGIAIAIAIAIHNIPEGIATATPIYFATGNKKHAFFISFLSGITEPIGAVIGFLILRPFFNDVVFGVLFGIIAGIMVFISLEELLPMAREYEKSKITIIGVIIGMAVIAVSLLLFFA